MQSEVTLGPRSYTMKILAVLLLVLFGYIFISSKIHAEGRGLEDASRFTRKSNKEEKEHPLAHTGPKDGIGRTVTLEKEKDLVKPKTSYRDRSARNDINSNAINNEKYSKEDVDDSGSEADGDSYSSTSSHHSPSVESYCSRPGIHCRKT